MPIEITTGMDYASLVWNETKKEKENKQQTKEKQSKKKQQKEKQDK